MPTSSGKRREGQERVTRAAYPSAARWPTPSRPLPSLFLSRLSHPRTQQLNFSDDFFFLFSPFRLFFLLCSSSGAG